MMMRTFWGIVFLTMAGFVSAAAETTIADFVKMLSGTIVELNAEYTEEVYEGDCYSFYRMAEDDTEVSLRFYCWRMTGTETDTYVAVNYQGVYPDSWLKFFRYNEKNKELQAVEIPFHTPEVTDFAKDSQASYWRIVYRLQENGDIWISSSPSMAEKHLSVVRWMKEDNGFRVYLQGSVFSPVFCPSDQSEEKEHAAYINNVIRPNFQRINEITDWKLIERKEVTDTTEGGDITYYYSDKKLEKAVAELYFETGKQLVEYYFSDRSLSFIYVKEYIYDKHVMDEDFDADKYTVSEKRMYIDGDLLIRYLGEETTEEEQIENYEFYISFLFSPYNAR